MCTHQEKEEKKEEKQTYDTTCADGQTNFSQSSSKIFQFGWKKP